MAKLFFAIRCQAKFVASVALFAVLLAFFVIALGAYTRHADAGLGCPDWPGCYGHLVVNASISYKGWVEMLHRYFVGILSVFLLMIIFLLVGCRAIRSPRNVLLAVILLGLLAYQILLGQLTVTLKLMPVIVSQHLFGGFFIFATLWLVYLTNTPDKYILENPLPHRKKLIFLSVGALLILFMQIGLGAWTSTNYASLSCPDFPFCMNGKTMHWHFAAAFDWVPAGVNFEGGMLSEPAKQTIQMLHRLGALMVSGWLLLLVISGFFWLTAFPQYLKLFYIILGLLVIQVFLGIANVVFQLPVWSAVSHTLMAVLLLISLETVIFRLWTAGRRSK